MGVPVRLLGSVLHKGRWLREEKKKTMRSHRVIAWSKRMVILYFVREP